MSSIDTDNFLHSLALAIASGSGLTYGIEGAGLWRWHAEPGNAELWSTLVIYGGDGVSGTVESESAFVQVLTRGKLAPAAMAQARKIFDVFVGEDCRAKAGLRIPAKTTAGVNDGEYVLQALEILSRPGSLGRDEKRLWMVSFNLSIRFVRLAAA